MAMDRRRRCPDLQPRRHRWTLNSNFNEYLACCDVWYPGPSDMELSRIAAGKKDRLKNYIAQFVWSLFAQSVE
jgi:hypothetical protein